MSEHLVVMAVALGIALAATIAVAVRSPELRGKMVGVGLGIAGALAAVVAVLTLSGEKKRAAEVAASTKEVKGGRQEALEDSKETEKELDSVVAAEVDTHEEAEGEQEELKNLKRERLKS